MKAGELAAQVEALRRYHAEHRSIPPLSVLAQLWGFSAKSWAAAIVARLKQQGVLEDAPGRRLRPGPQFPGLPADSTQARRPGRRRGAADPIEQAATTWASEVSDLAAEAYALSFRIVTIATMIEQGFQREVEPLGLNGGEVLLLDALRRAGPPYESSPTALKDSFLISFAGIGKRLERLERLGYVERRSNPRDRRSQVVRLTARGLSLLRSGFRKRYAAHILALMALAPEQRAKLSETLRQVQRHIEEGAAQGS